MERPAKRKIKYHDNMSARESLMVNRDDFIWNECHDAHSPYIEHLLRLLETNTQDEKDKQIEELVDALEYISSMDWVKECSLETKSKWINEFIEVANNLILKYRSRE